MNEFENQNLVWQKRNTDENREASFENKESQMDEQEKKAAARERAEVVSKEIHNTKKQLQNIMVNMQQVVKSVQAIRLQLQLNSTSGIPSVQHDKKQMEELKKKLTNLYGELGDLRLALIVELKKELSDQDSSLSDKDAEDLAEKRADNLWRTLDLGE